MTEQQWIWIVAIAGGVAVFLAKWTFSQIWKEIDSIKRHIERLYDRTQK